MVPGRVGIKFYLRSTFGFMGQDAASKGTTAETQTLATIGLVSVEGEIENDKAS